MTYLVVWKPVLVQYSSNLEVIWILEGPSAHRLRMDFTVSRCHFKDPNVVIILFFCWKKNTIE